MVKNYLLLLAALLLCETINANSFIIGDRVFVENIFFFTQAEADDFHDQNIDDPDYTLIPATIIEKFGDNFYRVQAELESPAGPATIRTTILNKSAIKKCRLHSPLKSRRSLHL